MCHGVCESACMIMCILSVLGVTEETDTATVNNSINVALTVKKFPRHISGLNNYRVYMYTNSTVNKNIKVAVESQCLNSS